MSLVALLRTMPKSEYAARYVKWYMHMCLLEVLHTLSILKYAFANTSKKKQW